MDANVIGEALRPLDVAISESEREHLELAQKVEEYRRDYGLPPAQQGAVAPPGSDLQGEIAACEQERWDIEEMRAQLWPGLGDINEPQ